MELKALKNNLETIRKDFDKDNYNDKLFDVIWHIEQAINVINLIVEGNYER